MLSVSQFDPQRRHGHAPLAFSMMRVVWLGGAMRWRRFLNLLGGSVLTWPIAVRAQPRLPLIGVSSRPIPNRSGHGYAGPIGTEERRRRVTRAKGHAMAKNTICLWYDKDAEAAARFYAETVPDSTVGAILRAPGDYPFGKKGDVLTVEFKVAGVSWIGLNGGTILHYC